MWKILSHWGFLHILSCIFVSTKKYKISFIPKSNWVGAKFFNNMDSKGFLSRQGSNYFEPYLCCFSASELLFSTGGSTVVSCVAASVGASPVADCGGVGTSSSAFFENIDVKDETWFVNPPNMIYRLITSFNKFILSMHFTRLITTCRLFYDDFSRVR